MLVGFDQDFKPEAEASRTSNRMAGLLPVPPRPQDASKARAWTTQPSPGSSRRCRILQALSPRQAAAG